ncbi:MAG: prolipoprotein diacylglyceryl transferase [Candidatus Omnitrophica bacterium]|nr:prolipoprotein diacylglyceryl transferase [Candidatus Omnitrophota bacterium]MCM8827168.1 prolipoprotein diacylglyceryl transferase [Candidatus Omnitrophota bacterium]
MHPVLFKVGPITIYTYGVLVFLGVIITYWLCLREAGKEKINKEVFSNIFFWTIIFGFLGARLLYIILEWRLFLEEPLSFIFGRSGFVFYGGLISGIFGLWLLVKKFKLPFLKIADILVLYLPLGHFFGRLGCFSYGCCYGKPTNSWIGIKFLPNSPAGLLGTKVIPTQLIEAFFLLIIFFILQYSKKKKNFPGKITIIYLTLYSIFRFFIEFFRGDYRGGIGILSTSQIISIITLITVFIILYQINTINKNI